MSKISYPRTQTRGDTQKKCHALVRTLDKLLAQGYLSDAQLEEVIAAIAEINWARGALSYRLKAIKRLHSLREHQLYAQKQAQQKQLDQDLKKRHELAKKIQQALENGDDSSQWQKQLSDLDRDIADLKHRVERLHRLELEIQVATLLLTPSGDVRPVAEKLNQPLPDEPDFTPYQFQPISNFNDVVYYQDPNGELLRDAYLAEVDIRQYEESPKSDATEYISDAERSRLEKEVDNINTLSKTTRQEILDGWMKGGMTDIDSEFEELQDYDKCVAVLDDLGVMFDTYDELGKRGVGKEMFHQYGYQKEHSPPYSCFTARLKLKGESRGQVPLIDGVKNYNEKRALCFAIFDGQSLEKEHYHVTRASEKFMAELQSKGEKATLGQWLDKAVEWNTEVFVQRLEREAQEPYNRDELLAQARKAAIAIRNVTKAHFVGMEGTGVLDLELENGKHRNKPVANSKGDAIDEF